MRGRPRKYPIDEPRHDLMADFERKLRNMHAACRFYNAKPIHEFTHSETIAFANRQADGAYESMKLQKDERLQYANAILSSIDYFNKRDERHKDHMRYLRECAERQRESEEQHRKDLQRQKQMMIFIK